MSSDYTYITDSSLRDQFWEQEIRELKAENERLRKMLEQINHWCHGARSWNGKSYTYMPLRPEIVRRIAFATQARGEGNYVDQLALLRETLSGLLFYVDCWRETYRTPDELPAYEFGDAEGKQLSDAGIEARRVLEGKP